MNKAHFDPQYGEMIGIAEASRLTGISTHTMRLWRRPEHAHLMKFPHYRSAGSQAVFYRLADVVGWLEANGVSETTSGLIPADLSSSPDAFVAPINASPIDAKKHQWLSELAKINTETIEKNGDAFAGWYGKIQDLVNPNFNAKRKEVMPGLFRLYFGLPSDYEVEYVWQNKRATHPDEWYVGGTLSLRRLYAEAKGWTVSDQEIVDLPIGDYVPQLNRNEN